MKAKNPQSTGNISKDRCALRRGRFGGCGCYKYFVCRGYSGSWGSRLGRRVGRHLSGGLITIIIAVIAVTIAIAIAIDNDIVARSALRREVGGGLAGLIVKFNNYDPIM